MSTTRSSSGLTRKWSWDIYTMKPGASIHSWLTGCNRYGNERAQTNGTMCQPIKIQRTTHPGMDAAALRNTIWLQGPEFLWEENLHLADTIPDLSPGEVKTVVLSVNTNPEQLNILERLTRMSDWPQMVRVLAWLRRPAAAKKGRKLGSIAQERKDAELFILQLV